MITFLEFVHDINKKLIEKFGNYKVFLVDAEKLRKISVEDDQFNHIGTHLGFPKLIPNNEIWISKDEEPHEIQILIHTGIAQYEAKNKGIKDYYNYAIKKEKAEREKVDGIKPNKKEKPPKKLYYEHYCNVDDFKVFLIDGELCRDLYYTSFIEGANPFVYKWCPKNELWIEKDLLKHKGEVDITILHEYTESMLMKYKKYTYDKAHNIASKIEQEFRNKKWDKSDVESLTPEKALQMAKKYIS